MGAARRCLGLVDRLRAAGRPCFHSHHESPRAQAQRLIDISRVTTPASRNATAHGPRGRGLLSARCRADHRARRSARRKLVYLRELVALSWFYVLDFSRAAPQPSDGARTPSRCSALGVRRRYVPLAASNIAYWMPLIVCTV